jgi:SPP1 gp7 family putative phage head morphogenesis protein
VIEAAIDAQPSGSVQMLRYSIAKLGRQAGRKKGTTADLPIIEGRLGTEKAYYSALRSMLAEMARETRESIIPAYEAEQRQKRAERTYTGDADQSWFSRLRALTVALQRVASDTVNRILGLEAVRHTDQFMAAAKKAIGIDLRSVVQQEDLADYLTAAAARNVSLITGLADDTVKRIEQTVPTLRKALQEDFGVADRRARLIARDQTAKLNSDLNRIRQEQAGVTSYSWLTSRDERVRERHRKLDGKVYKWGEATGAEQGLPPGQPINCRCVARGIVEF